MPQVPMFNMFLSTLRIISSSILLLLHRFGSFLNTVAFHSCNEKKRFCNICCRWKCYVTYFVYIDESASYARVYRALTLKVRLKMFPSIKHSSLLYLKNHFNRSTGNSEYFVFKSFPRMDFRSTASAPKSKRQLGINIINLFFFVANKEGK